ncbi:MAG TPA: homocysteine S-methyltransferase [Candidatus Limnocylindrales bacterium]|jgi:homocysteine S-methyltransferase
MDSTAFRAALDASEVIVLDGGLATQLEAQGADLTDALWSARLLSDAPEEIVAAHVAYYRAGARVATTASYQATFEGFARRGIAHDDAAALMRRSVELAADARAMVVGERAATDPVPLFVAASIGPYGALLADGAEYRGRYGRSAAELRAFHRERLAVLASTAADVLAVETIPELEEAVAVAGLLTETEGAAAWISFTCGDGARLRSGGPIEEAVAAVDGTPGLLAIGVNCTAPEHIDELVGRIATTTDLPIVVYPNSGEGWDAAHRTWTGATAGRVDAAAGNRWLAAGARLIGGCCRVTPDQVRALASGLPPGAIARSW